MKEKKPIVKIVFDNKSGIQEIENSKLNKVFGGGVCHCCMCKPGEASGTSTANDNGPIKQPRF